MIKEKKVIDFILTILIFYQVFITSSWQIIHPEPIWKFLGYIFYLFLFLMIIFELVEQKIYGGRLLFCIFCLFLSFCYFYKANIWCGVLFLFCAASILIDADNLLTDYFNGIGLSFLCIIFLTLFKILPYYNEYGLISLGFRNPNTTGFYLLVLFLIYLYKQKGQNKLTVFVLLLILLFIAFEILEDQTVFAMLILSFLLYILIPVWGKLNDFWLFRILLFLFPILLTVITYWIGKNYLNFSWMERLNDTFTNRPIIWNFYLSQFPPSLFSTSLSDNINFFDGAFDGSFLYYPTMYGLLFFGLILYFACKSLFLVSKEKLCLLEIILLILLLTAVSENSPFVVTQSPLVPLFTSVMVMKESVKEKTNLNLKE